MDIRPVVIQLISDHYRGFCGVAPDLNSNYIIFKGSVRFSITIKPVNIVYLQNNDLGKSFQFTYAGLRTDAANALTELTSFLREKFEEEKITKAIFKLTCLVENHIAMK